MELKQLRYFVSVALRLNFTDAAAEHFVAQSAISYQISKLEEQIGVQLLIRNKRSVRLTDAGTQLLKDAIKLIDQYEETINRVRLAGNRLSGKLKIGLFGPEKLFFPKLLEQFNKKYPDVNIELIQFTRNNLNASLLNGEIDIGFTLSISIEKENNINWCKIGSIPFNLVLNHRHPLAKNDKVSLTAIESEPVITISQSVSPDGYKHLISLFTKHGHTPNIIKECSRFETVLLMVEADLGIAILPRAMAEIPPNLSFIELDEIDEDLDFVIAWNRNNTNPFISFFISEFNLFMETHADTPILNIKDK
jgi:DNA-binding transcriptional LysR family regulator